MFSTCCNSGIKSWRKQKDLKKLTKIKPFTNKYNWKAINFLSEIKDWKKIEENTVTIALNVLYAKKEKKYILLMF